MPRTLMDTVTCDWCGTGASQPDNSYPDLAGWYVLEARDPPTDEYPKNSDRPAQTYYFCGRSCLSYGIVGQSADAHPLEFLIREPVVAR